MPLKKNNVLKLLLAPILLLSFSQFSTAQELNNTQKNYISTPKAFSAYDDLRNKADHYNDQNTKNRFNEVYESNKNKISIQDGEKNQGLDTVWKGKFFSSIFFMYNGFIDRANQNKIPANTALVSYQNLSKDFFAKKSHQLYAQMTTQDYAFNYNMLGVLKSFMVSQSMIQTCKNQGDPQGCLEKGKQQFSNSSDLFSELYGDCLSLDNKVTNECIIKEIDTDEFTKSMAYQNYLVGYALYDSVKK